MTPKSVILAVSYILFAALITGPSVVAQDAPKPPAPTVTVAAPLKQRITTWDEYSGRFEAVESVEIRPRVSGFIDKILFKEGETVQAGAPLYIIDPRPFQIAVESAKADIARAQAQVDLGRNEVERARPLLQSGAVTGRDFDQRNANLNVQIAALQSAQASLKAAELNLEWTTVTAPVAGRISDTKIDIGNLVTGGASGATLLTTIVSLDPIHFLFDVSDADYLRYARLSSAGLRPSSRDTANPVKVRLGDEEGWVHEGKMDFVDNQFNARSGTMRGRAVLKNTDGLLAPGIFARIRLFGGEVDALLVPDQAIIADQARKIVLTVDENNKVVPKPVTLGPIDQGLRVIKDGLAPDAKVVIAGLANPAVRPGSTVTPEAGEIKSVPSPGN